MKLQINKHVADKLIELRVTADKTVTQLMYEAIDDILDKYKNKGVLHDSQRTANSNR